jgi:hypothetical protein
LNSVGERVVARLRQELFSTLIHQVCNFITFLTNEDVSHQNKVSKKLKYVVNNLRKLVFLMSQRLENSQIAWPPIVYETVH